MSQEYAVLARLWTALDRSRGERHLPDGVWAPTSIALKAIDRLLGRETRRVAFDPWVTSGVALTFVVETGIVQRGIGIAPNQADLKIAQEISTGLPIDWTHQGSWEDGNPAVQNPDLVISMPPWAYRRSGGVDPIRETLFKAWTGLNPSGVGLAVLEPGFFSRDRGLMTERLKRRGLYVDSVIDLPPGTFAPNTHVGGVVVMVRRGSIRDVFCARLSGEPDRDHLVFNNATTRTASHTDVALGFLIAPSSYEGLDRAIAEQALERLAGPAARLRVDLGELTLALKMGRAETSFLPHESAVYVPLIGKGPAHSRLEDTTMKSQNYAQVIVDENRVLPEWLAGYLSGPLGLQARDSVLSGTWIPRINKSAVSDIPVYLPSLSDQMVATQAAQGIRVLREKLSELSQAIWIDPTAEHRLRELFPTKTEEEAFNDWVSTVPFPLASILRTYQAAGNDYKARYEHLLHFFEAIAEFHALILLSAVTTDERLRAELLTDVSKALSKADLTYQMATFGCWRITVEILAKRLRPLQDDRRSGGKERLEGLLKTGDSLVTDLLLGKAVSTILQKTNQYRNDWGGHGPIVSEQEARRRSGLLWEAVLGYSEVAKDAWSRYELVIAGPMRLTNGQFLSTVEVSMGPTTPFTKKEIGLSAPLDDRRLYLLGSGRADALRLLPLIRLMPSPKTAANACYFYNRMKDGQSRFVSYHFEQDAEIMDAFPDVAEALKMIDVRPGGGPAS